MEKSRVRNLNPGHKYGSRREAKFEKKKEREQVLPAKLETASHPKRPRGVIMSPAMTKALHAINEIHTMPNASSLIKDQIPIYREIFTKGAQNPTLRLKTSLTNVLSSAGGVINTVQYVSFGQILGFGDWNNVFDEYRILRAHFEYVPHAKYAMIYGGTTAQLMSTARTMTSCIDFEATAPLTSKNEGWGHQTGKVNSTNENQNWHVELDWLPDEEWISTQTTGTVLATLKLYADGCVASTAHGEIFGWIDIQFRQAIGV